MAVGGLRAADSPAKPRVDVIFSHPDKFTDAAQDVRGSDWGRDENLDTLKDYLVRHAERYLAAGQTLTVTFTDIDLAGEYEPWLTPGQGREARIVRDIYTPKMDLSFKLTDASGKVIKEGTRHLTNLTFMMDILPVTERNEPMPWDKELLNDWVRKEFRGLNKK